MVGNASWLVVWTNPFEKYARQIGSSPQLGVNIKNIWNHHPDQLTLAEVKKNAGGFKVAVYLETDPLWIEDLVIPLTEISSRQRAEMHKCTYIDTSLKILTYSYQYIWCIYYKMHWFGFYNLGMLNLF